MILLPLDSGMGNWSLQESTRIGNGQRQRLAWWLEWFVDVNGCFVGGFDAYVFSGSQVAVVVDEVCGSPYLEASGSPRLDGGEVVHDEGDFRIF